MQVPLERSSGLRRPETKKQAGVPGILAASTPSPWLKSSRHMQAATTNRGTSGVANAKAVRTVGASKIHCKAKAFCTSKGGLACVL